MKTFLAVIGAITLPFLICLLFAYPEMLLINYAFSPTVLIVLFGGAVTYWKTVALSFVTTFLFKSTK
jgi:hypothetical protein